jgi:MFS family permease
MTEAQIEAVTMRHIAIRLLPFLMLGYLVAGIDRVNVGFAALQMNQALGISPTAFGLGGGIFFVSYFLFEVPSNLAFQRVGASKWIARIMITWGAVSAGTAFIGGSQSFLVLRFLLGAAEAGFFPGVILYLTYWFPAEQRARIIGIFMVATPISGLIGAPVSGMLLNTDGIGRSAGYDRAILVDGPAVGGDLAHSLD